MELIKGSETRATEEIHTLTLIILADISCDGHHPRSGQLALTRLILLRGEQELDDRSGHAARP
jgi:hypothetical protein